jgi:hypothetical protein
MWLCCYLVFSVVIIDEDKLARSLRATQVVRVVTGVTVVKVTILRSYLHF